MPHILCCLFYNRLFPLSALLLVSICAFGQDNDPKKSQLHGNFEVNTIKGCAPLSVTATNTSGYDPEATPIVWNMDWDGDEDNIEVDPNQSSGSAEYVYESPGVYKILQVISPQNSETQLDTITIEVMEPRDPEFKVENCAGSRIFVDASLEAYYEQLRIDYGDGSPVDVVKGVSITHQYPGPGTYTITVEGMFDNAGTHCGQADTTITITEQEELEPGKIDQVEVLDQQSIRISYTLPQNISYRLEVSKNSTAGFTFASYELDHNAGFLLMDKPSIDTQKDYFCFRITAVDRCNDEKLYSETICSIALQAVVGDLKSYLSWKTSTDGFAEFMVLKNGGRISTTGKTSFTDDKVQCPQEYTYQVVAKKSGMVSMSEVLTLKAARQDILPAINTLNVKANGLEISLDWEDAPKVQQYYIYREEAGASLQLIDSVENATEYVDQQLNADTKYCYQISYMDECGSESRLSSQVCDRTPKQGQIFLPTAFTPNGDGVNDVFMYRGNLIEQIELKIFNRWGELVFYTDQLDAGWDGVHNGVPAPEGSYVYHVYVTDELGNQFRQKGAFTLLIPRNY